jgi:preprotein translocase subunit SecA
MIQRLTSSGLLKDPKATAPSSHSVLQQAMHPMSRASSLPLSGQQALPQTDQVHFAGGLKPPAAKHTVSMPAIQFGGVKIPLIGKYLQRLSGDRKIAQLKPVINQITALEAQVSQLSDEQLAAKTPEFKARITKAVGKPLEQLDLNIAKDALALQAALDQILPEAFAVVREVANRQVKMRPYDVQMMAGVVLHQNKIAEMKTGEGKTLSAAMPVYLNALAGKGVHLVTANEYLAKRDAEEMSPVYKALGLSVGVIYSQQDKAEKKKAYASDVTYGTHSEFGFDYLRDHIGTMRQEDRVQRDFFFAIVDEADNILIDEAKTPLIISATSEMQLTAQNQYRNMAKVANALSAPADYEIEYGKQLVKLTDDGAIKAERLLGEALAAGGKDNLFALTQSLKAKEFFHLDKHYVIENGEIVIVDHFTGRRAYGRRWSQGLHMAIECKEAFLGKEIRVQGETETDASITYQNYFRLYPKRSGMTGTAMTEEQEFLEVYGTPVVAIPTNRPYIQKSMPDVMLPNQATKFDLVAREIKRVNETGQPILVGTASIEDSEQLSEMLKTLGVPHEVLNAKQHEREAKIVANAGRLGAVTIATNMAGRGTDIKLGGSPGYYKDLIAKETEAQQKIQRDLDELNRYIAKTEPNQADLIEQRLNEAKKRLLDQNPEYVFDPAELEQAKTYMAQQLEQELAGAKRNVSERTQDLTASQAKVADYQVQLEQDGQNRDANRQKIKELGGLYVIGMERNESRRIDNQLAGRCARQGDPGLVRFFVSTEDELFKVNGQVMPHWKNVSHALEWLVGAKTSETENMPEGKRLDALMAQTGWFVKRFRKQLGLFQQKTEEKNYDGRKHLLKYDTVMDHFRRETYSSRDKLLKLQNPADFRAYLETSVHETLLEMFTQIQPALQRFSSLTPERIAAIQLARANSEPIPADMLADYQVLYLVFQLSQATQMPIEAFKDAWKKDPEALTKEHAAQMAQKLEGLTRALGQTMAPTLLRQVMIGTKDTHWKGFLNNANALKDSVQSEGMSGKDPLMVYQSEVPKMYQQMRRQETWEILKALMPLCQMVQGQETILSELLDQFFAAEPGEAQRVDMENLPVLMNTFHQINSVALKVQESPEVKPLANLWASLPSVLTRSGFQEWTPLALSLLNSPIPGMTLPLSEQDTLGLNMYQKLSESLVNLPEASGALKHKAQAVMSAVGPLLQPAAAPAPEPVQPESPSAEAPVAEATQTDATGPSPSPTPTPEIPATKK